MPAEVDPARLEDLRRLLARQRARPRKRLGQTFLVDPELRDRVVAASGAGPDDSVLEVGAGPGTLSLRLADRCRWLLAVELDPGLASLLRSILADRPNASVVEGDILELDLAARFPGGGEIVAGNIPYYLSGALLRKLLDHPPRPRRLSLVVQREVALRWTGRDGSSLATVAAQVFTEPRLELLLPAAAFWPRPRVDSALVLMEVRAEPLVPAAEQPGFFRLVEATFQFRRKQLRASLGRLYGLPGAAAGLRLEAAGVEPSRRPETLAVAEWRALLAAFGPLSTEP